MNVQWFCMLALFFHEVASILTRGSKSQLSLPVEIHVKDGPLRHGAIFKFGQSSAEKHPSRLRKSEVGASTGGDVIEYEAMLPAYAGAVLNLYSHSSNGKGGLLVALEAKLPCSTTAFVEVDRSRCSMHYPCALRLPALAVPRGDRPTSFRLRVVSEEEDYGTSYMDIKKIVLDHDGEVLVAQGHVGSSPPVNKTMRFSLTAAQAAGGLAVVPLMDGIADDMRVTMAIRQGVSDHAVSLYGADKLEWLSQWRHPVADLVGCSPSFFEIGADQLIPGDVELEVSFIGGKADSVADILVTTRASWAEAEDKLLEQVLKAHFGFYSSNLPFSHGLALSSIHVGIEPKGMGVSNPTEWGLAMTAWIVMSEMGTISPDDAKRNITTALNTIKELQRQDRNATHGLLYPMYVLRTGTKYHFPKKNEKPDVPCGDLGLLYGSLKLIQGWLLDNKDENLAELTRSVAADLDFSYCIHVQQCQRGGVAVGDSHWAVTLTYDADTMEYSDHNWNLWADESGAIAMELAMSGAMNDTQFRSVVGSQQKFSPCSSWKGVTVRNSAYFNTLFTLPQRSMMGLGTILSSSYMHEFAVRSLLPTMRAHQRLRDEIEVDYIGPSDAMTQRFPDYPDVYFGSYAYFPPNARYDCAQKKVVQDNQCTWCKRFQAEGIETGLKFSVPHGNLVPFLALASMERSLFKSWVEQLKLLMTDASGVYHPTFGFEVMAPAHRTPLNGSFAGAASGRGIFETLSHSYSTLSMYEGLATMRRKYEILAAEGKTAGHVPTPIKPFSDFLDKVPGQRQKLDGLLDVAKSLETNRGCPPSEFGIASHGL